MTCLMYKLVLAVAAMVLFCDFPLVAAQAEINSTIPAPSAQVTSQPSKTRMQSQIDTAEAEYQLYRPIVMNMSVRSAQFIKDYWRLEGTFFNAAFTTWPFTKIIYTHSDPKCQNIDKSIYPDLLVMCGGHYWVTSSGPYRECWKIIKSKDILETFVFTNDTDKPIKRFMQASIGDGRVIKHDGRVFISYPYVHEKRFFRIFQEELFYNETLDALYVIKPSYLLHAADMHSGHQKNWAPFVYEPNPGEWHIYYIYFVNPLTILQGNHTHLHPLTSVFGHPTQPLKMTVVSSSAVTGTNDSSVAASLSQKMDFWKWGPPRGGTPATLVDTPYGRRYLCFFHSSGSLYTKTIKTYFMGAYLFEPHPPFIMTHVTKEPIIPRAFYDDDVIKKWAFKNINIIVFPMGIFVANDTIFLSMGSNDQSSYTVSIYADGLYKSMISVNSEVNH